MLSSHTVVHGEQPPTLGISDVLVGLGLTDTNFIDQKWSNITCDEAIDNLLFQLPDFGSIFYVILNGWYLGQWGDYDACASDTTYGQFVLATINGDYVGPVIFPRGG